jgi:hypothetical protein
MTNDFVWTTDIELILDNVRKNCVIMSKMHKKRYLYFKGVLRYFRIPIIILSGLNSVISVGLQPYIEQRAISATTCLISLICGIVGSIEMYLSIQTHMESELLMSKEYYLLSIDLFKVLSLDRENRNLDSRAFLDEKFGIYEKLIENSNISSKKYDDNLAPLPHKSKQQSIMNNIQIPKSFKMITPSSTPSSTSTKNDIVNELIEKISTSSLKSIIKSDNSSNNDSDSDLVCIDIESLKDSNENYNEV